MHDVRRKRVDLSNDVTNLKVEKAKQDFGNQLLHIIVHKHINVVDPQAHNCR